MHLHAWLNRIGFKTIRFLITNSNNPDLESAPLYYCIFHSKSQEKSHLNLVPIKVSIKIFSMGINNREKWWSVEQSQNPALFCDTSWSDDWGIWALFICNILHLDELKVIFSISLQDAADILHLSTAGRQRCILGSQPTAVGRLVRKCTRITQRRIKELFQTAGSSSFMHIAPLATPQSAKTLILGSAFAL